MDAKQKAKYSLRGWTKKEYIEYAFSMGGILIGTLLVFAFTIATALKHIKVPAEIYSIPIGMGFFFLAYSADSVAHRSSLKNGITDLERQIHDFMVFWASFPLFASFILAYFWPHLMMPFILTFLFMKAMSSFADEFVCHYPRFKVGALDNIEMGAHFVQFASNVMFDVGFMYLIYWNHYEIIKKLFN